MYLFNSGSTTHITNTQTNKPVDRRTDKKRTPTITTTQNIQIVDYLITTVLPL